MVTRLPARFHVSVTALRVQVISQQQYTNPGCSFADPFLPARRPVFSEQRPEKATFLAKAPLFKAAIKLWSLLDCQAENVASSSRTLGDQRVKRGSAAFIRPT